jgi:hypothetical protein
MSCIYLVPGVLVDLDLKNFIHFKKRNSIGVNIMKIHDLTVLSLFLKTGL